MIGKPRHERHCPHRPISCKNCQPFPHNSPERSTALAQKRENSANPRRGATVAPAFVRGMLAAIAPAEHAALLAACDIDAAVLGDAPPRVPIDAYARLYNHVALTRGDEAFGLFARPMPPGSFELLCRAVLAAPTLAEALDRIGRFLAVLLPDVHVTVARRGDRAELSIRELTPLGRGRTFALEWLLRLVHGLACWLVGRGVALDRVDFPYPEPAHAADYALIYTEDSRFDAPVLCAHFAANLLELPVRRDETALGAFLVGAPGRLTMLYRRDRELVLRVRDLLRRALPVMPRLGDVAQAMNLSPRTLHRRLEDEGASFQSIKDALRRDIAIARLTKTDRPVADIAHELGFADPSAFYRAFVGWTGLSPQQYRQRLGDQR